MVAQTAKKPRAPIVGGAVTATALRGAGLETAVFERADDLGRAQSGAGLYLNAHGELKFALNTMPSPFGRGRYQGTIQFE